MKPSELKVGKTYVGHRGEPRKVAVLYDDGDVVYDLPSGKTRHCRKPTFARWAKRLARDEERVASPEPAISRWRHTA